MSTENRILDVSYEAAEDLSNDQYRFIVLDPSTGKVRRPDSSYENSHGILQNAPGSGEAAVVRIEGISKLQVNAALAIGRRVKSEYVSATDAGKGQLASVADYKNVRGIVVEASSAEDDLASVLLINAPLAAKITTAATVNTATAVTLTVAQLMGGMILQDPNGGACTATTPTAAEIVAAIPDAMVGSSFEFTIRNTADANETITVSGGSNVTISGTATIGQNNSKRFLAVCTNVTASSETVTIYSLGTSVH